MSGTENVGERRTVERATVSTQSGESPTALGAEERDPLLDSTIAQATGSQARKRSVSLYWLEKSFLLLDYAQLLGFMWIISRVWPWPEGLRLYLKWTAIVVGDIHAYFDAPKFQGSIDDWFDARGFSISAGRRPGWRYYSYLTVFMGLSAGCIGFFLLAHGLRKRLRRLLRLGFAASRAIYLPIAVTAARLCSCRVLGNRLSTDYPRYYEKRGITAVDLVMLDPNEACQAIPHIRMLSVLSICLAFLVLLPAYVALSVSRRIVHADADAHERYVRCRELEHLAGFSSTWRVEAFYLFSSFRRGYAYQEAHLLVHKGLVALLLLMPDEHAWSLAQLVVYIALVAAMPLLRPWPYRCTSSNVMYQILHWLLVMQAWPGLLLHQGMESFFLLPNVMWATMLILNLGALTVIAVVAAVPYRQRRRTGKGVWPVHHGVLERMRHDWLGGRVLAALMESRRFFHATIRRPALLVPRDEVEAAMVRLQEVLDDARVEGHILVDALDDAMDDLVTLECKAKDSVIPNRRLRALMAQLRVKMDARESALVMVDPRKARALLKLVALRAVTAGRSFPFCPDEAAAAQLVEDEAERMAWEELEMGRLGEGGGRRGMSDFFSATVVDGADVPLLLGTETSSGMVDLEKHGKQFGSQVYRGNGPSSKMDVRNGTLAKSGNQGFPGAGASVAADATNVLSNRQDSKGRVSGGSSKSSQHLAREGTLALTVSGHPGDAHAINIPGHGECRDVAGNSAEPAREHSQQQTSDSGHLGGGLTGADQRGMMPADGTHDLGLDEVREGAPYYPGSGPEASGGMSERHMAAQHWLPSPSDLMEFSFGKSLRVRPAAAAAGGDLSGLLDKHAGKSRFAKSPG